MPDHPVRHARAFVASGLLLRPKPTVRVRSALHVARGEPDKSAHGDGGQHRGAGPARRRTPAGAQREDSGRKRFDHRLPDGIEGPAKGPETAQRKD